MNKKVLVIVPTRGRPAKVQEFYDQFKATSIISDLIFGIDEDDDSVYPQFEDAKYEVGPRLRMNGTLNALATKYANDYEYIAFMGDDHRPRTPAWDIILTNGIADKKYGITYGNDLFMGEKIPTAVLLKSEIVKVLGFMAPPILIHLFLDNFWKFLGENLNSLVYNNDVIIEHMHYLIGKSDADELYLEVNSDKIASHDNEKYSDYVLSGQFAEDLKKFV
jgi:hypothetical protein